MDWMDPQMLIFHWRFKDKEWRCIPMSCKKVKIPTNWKESIAPPNIKWVLVHSILSLSPQHVKLEDSSPILSQENVSYWIKLFMWMQWLLEADGMLSLESFWAVEVNGFHSHLSVHKVLWNSIGDTGYAFTRHWINTKICSTAQY